MTGHLTPAFLRRYRRAYRELVLQHVMTSPSARLPRLTPFRLVEVYLLSLLQEEGPLPMVEIRRRFYPLDKFSLSRLCAGLSRKGLLTQSRREDDARGKTVSLTPAGQRATSRLAVTLNTRARHQLAVLPIVQQKRLLRALEDAVEVRRLLRPPGEPPEKPSWLRAKAAR